MTRRKRQRAPWPERIATVVFIATLLAWGFTPSSWPYHWLLFAALPVTYIAWVHIGNRRERTMRFTIPRATYDDLVRWQRAGALSPNQQARTALYRYVVDLRRNEHRHGRAQTITVSSPPDSGDQ